MERFIELWTHPDYPPAKVDETGLIAVERHFGFALPRDYREAVLSWGLPSTTIDLLDTIVDRELDVADVGDLYDPATMIAQTEAWRKIGLPGTHVAFASDCCGNMFCFSTDELRSGTEGTPVHYFDHDFGTVETVAQSFDSWIDQYCALASG